MIEAFFTRPGARCEISDRIKNDIKYAHERIIGALYYLTEDEIISEIEKSNVPIKRFVLYKDAKNNNSKKSKRLLRDSNIAFLGNDQMIMHHKFLIIDNILWIGSYNLSSNAANNNWENVLRLTDTDIIKRYYDEFKNIFLFANALCEKDWEIKCNDFICTKCKNKIKDPYLHFRIKVKIVSDSAEYYESDGEREWVVHSQDLSDFRIDSYHVECIDIYGKDKEKCSCCKKTELSEKLNIIEFYKNIEKYDDMGIDFGADGEIIYNFEKRSEKKMMRPQKICEKLCLSCLYEKLSGYIVDF